MDTLEKNCIAILERYVWSGIVYLGIWSRFSAVEMCDCRFRTTQARCGNLHKHAVQWQQWPNEVDIRNIVCRHWFSRNLAKMLGAGSTCGSSTMELSVGISIACRCCSFGGIHPTSPILREMGCTRHERFRCVKLVARREDLPPKTEGKSPFFKVVLLTVVMGICSWAKKMSLFDHVSMTSPVLRYTQMKLVSFCLERLWNGRCTATLNRPVRLPTTRLPMGLQRDWWIWLRWRLLFDGFEVSAYALLDQKVLGQVPKKRSQNLANSLLSCTLLMLRPLRLKTLREAGRQWPGSHVKCEHQTWGCVGGTRRQAP